MLSSIDHLLDDRHFAKYFTTNLISPAEQNNRPSFLSYGARSSITLSNEAGRWHCIPKSYRAEVSRA